MSEFEKRISKLEDNFDTFAHDTTKALNGISNSLAKMEANKPVSFMQIVTGVISISVMIGSLAAGVIYITAATNEPRLKLIEYKLNNLERNNWHTTVK